MKNYIIPIFIPHYGCRNECVFCNQHKITGVQTDVTPAKIKSVIEYHLGLINRERHVEIAFYGGSFTAIPLETQTAFLSIAQAYLNQNKIQAIRLSTRPDCISDHVVDHLISFGVKTVEIGVQSFDDAILKNARRGHTANDICNAVKCIRRWDLRLGIQLMPGLPGDNWLSIMRTLVETVRQQPDFVRIYPTVVLKSTVLAKLYETGVYAPLTMKAALNYSMIMKLCFEKNKIDVIRTGLQATEQLNDSATLLAGPYHPAFGEMVDARIFGLMVSRLLEQLPVKDKIIIIYHHRCDTSKVRGNKNDNTKMWYAVYGMKQILFRAELEMTGQIVVEFDRQSYFLTKHMFEPAALD